jgi:hypothetical protein
MKPLFIEIKSPAWSMGSHLSFEDYMSCPLCAIWNHGDLIT